jgi:hypothetical protein
MDIYQIREVLMWCSIINVALLTFIFILVTAGRKFICKLHCDLFKINEQQFNGAIYSFIGGYKLVVFVFNIVPFIAVSIAT